MLQEKLAEAHGLAVAAATVTAKVEERVVDRQLVEVLARLRRDAEETRVRCLAAERAYPQQLAVEIVAHANSTRDRAVDLAGAWFRAGTGPTAAWSFLAMAEAGEVATWTALAELTSRAGADGLAELAAWALPIQRRHLELALDGAALLAALTHPNDERWG